MRIEGSTALVTGANRGLGKDFVERLVARGAGRVYAAARDSASLRPLVEAHPRRVMPLHVDMTVPASIEALPAAAPELDILISNAGITHLGPMLETDDATERRLFEVNYRGPLFLTRVFADRLRARGDAAGILYVLSMAALMPVVFAATYSASKAAAMMMAHAVRAELQPAGVSVSMAYPGFIDTDMGAVFTVPKASPADLVDHCLDGLLANRAAIFPDRFAQMTRTCLETEMPQLIDDPVGTLTALVDRFAADPAAGQ